jgi:hypothetical protein
VGFETASIWSKKHTSKRHSELLWGTLEKEGIFVNMKEETK